MGQAKKIRCFVSEDTLAVPRDGHADAVSVNGSLTSRYKVSMPRQIIASQGLSAVVLVSHQSRTANQSTMIKWLAGLVQMPSPVLEIVIGESAGGFGFATRAICYQVAGFLSEMLIV